MISAIDSIVEGLVQHGYAQVDSALPDMLTQQLYQRIISLPDSTFRVAKIGRAAKEKQDQTIRNDRTKWLDNDNPIESSYLLAMAQLQTALNRRLFLGLRSFESHFAHYPPGHFYQRHLDAFSGDLNRKVSSVFYLNPSWTTSDGGELVLYQQGFEPVSHILPKGGRLVVFLSEEFPHEVLAATRDRYSIAGWFSLKAPT